MTDEKANVPKLRFPGFTDPWEQRRLNEYLEVSKEKNSSERFGRHDVLSVSGDCGIVNQIEFQGRSYAGASVSNYGVVHKGDVVYTKSPLRANPYGIIKANRGNDGIVSTLYAVYHPLGDTCSDFVQIYFEQNARMNNYMAPLVNKGAKNDMKVSAANALKGCVTFPGIAEQKVISALFRDLDSLITLHQRELDHLKLQKRGLLQKMFPKDGSNVPELRFPGFTDPWEQRRLGDVVDVRSGRDYKHLSKGDIPVYGTGGYMTSVSEALSYSADAIGIGRKGTIDSPYILKAPFWTVDTLFYSIPCQSVDLSFAFCLFLNVDWRVKDESSGVPSLSKRTIDETTVTAPSESEQRQIGALFRDLDSLITLHQRELDHLKLQKKALLQQMFV